jgi:hypothetical protein
MHTHITGVFFFSCLMIKECFLGPAVSLMAPFDLTNYVGTNITLTFGVIGSTDGEIWGTTIYECESACAVAVVHAGFVRPGESCIVTFQMLPSISQFNSTTQNGITSTYWGQPDGAYIIINATCIN